MKPIAAFVIAVSLVSAGARAQDKLFPTGKPYPNFYFEGPSEKAAISWPNSCIVVLRRTIDPLSIKAGRMGRGALDMKCSVVACSRPDGPKSVVIRLGMAGPPDSSLGQPWPAERAAAKDRDLPVFSTYLAVITKPREKEWGQFEGPVVPRLIVTTNESFRPIEGSSAQTMLKTLFRAVSTGPAHQAPSLTQWLYAEWRTEAVPLIAKWQPAFPPDNRLSALSGNPGDTSTGSAAISESAKAGPSERIYLTMLGAIWGASEGFQPFFDSCFDRKAKPDLDLLSSMVDNPGFQVLPFSQALVMARKAGSMGGVVLKLAKMEGPVTQDDRKELFFLSSLTGRDWDRIYIYETMVRDMPVGSAEEFPKGFWPPYRSNGSIPEEAAYRTMWQKYLGLPSVDPP